jgi:hypothetical protein
MISPESLPKNGILEKRKIRPPIAAMPTLINISIFPRSLSENTN